MNENHPFKNEQAEMAVLGAIMHDPENVLSIALRRQAKSDWFTSPQRQGLWSVIVDLRFHDKPVDMVSIADRARTMGQLSAIQNIIAEAYDMCLTTAHAEHYLSIVEEKYLCRRTASIMQEALDKCKEGLSPAEIANKVRFELDVIDEQIASEMTKEQVYEAIKETVRLSEEEGHIGIPSRWMPLQRKLGGYKKGKMCVLAARPSIGKTTYLLNELRIMAEIGYKVGFISLETDTIEIYETMAAEAAEVDLFKRRVTGWDDDEKKRFDIALGKVLKLPIFISTVSMDKKHAVNWIRYMANKHNLDFVGLDYIGIITPDKDEEKATERLRVSGWSKALFRAFRDNNIAGMVLCQINRLGEAPPTAKLRDRWRYIPRLHNLKDSGAIEEDAYQCILLYNEPTKHDMSDEVRIPLIADVAKHKRGPTGKVKMFYKKDLQRIETTMLE